MKQRHFSTWFTALVLVAGFGCAGPALAVTRCVINEDNSSDGCNDGTGEGCSGSGTTGPNGDPTECPWPMGQTASGFLQCIADEICGEDTDGDGLDVGVAAGEQNNASMDFWLDDSPGCTQGSDAGTQQEIFSYCLREEGDFIWSVLIEVEQPNLVAKIHRFVENPGRTGEIRIGINSDMLVVDVGPALQSADKLNKIVCSALERDFRAACLDDFFVVYADSLNQTPRGLSVSTAGSGVSTTELALEPNGGKADVTACSEPSGPALAIVPPR